MKILIIALNNFKLSFEVGISRIILYELTPCKVSWSTKTFEPPNTT